MKKKNIPYVEFERLGRRERMKENRRNKQNRVEESVVITGTVMKVKGGKGVDYSYEVNRLNLTKKE